MTGLSWRLSEGPSETKTLRIDDHQEPVSSLKAIKIPLQMRTSNSMNNVGKTIHTVAGPADAILVEQKFALPTEMTPQKAQRNSSVKNILHH